ncbi:hypothetical protein D9619_000195 [Psilocybe cf. subviscida]|uniref:Uncharacterized protein n=1 Tax=Psilocybe cf. subviscida TaxID=2480587 RepID=A0A8H5BDN1_9AGAR|nr:hypothetical protein D9619_000195 [Psilocybe cf. subviscida]
MATVAPSILAPSNSDPNSAALAGLSQEESDALKAAVFQRLHPRAYLERFVAENVRPDGRAFEEFRGLSVNVGE